MDTFAAHDVSLLPGETQYDVTTISDEPVNETVQHPEITENTDYPEAPENTDLPDITQSPETPADIPDSNSETALSPDTESMADIDSTQNGMASVSMSDIVPQPNMMIPAAARATEKLDLDVTWPDSSYRDGILTLKNGEMPFTILPGLSGSTVNTPILKIQIPSCMDRSSLDYPDAANQYLKPFLSSTDPVSVSQDGSGNTILTYRFAPRIGWVNFSVGTKIKSGYQIKSGETYSIRLDYYDGSTLLLSKEETFTTKNPSLEKGAVWISSSPYSFSEILRENTSTYDVGSYSWGLSATAGHYPYTSLKMIAPLPSGATPGFGTGSSFTALQNNETRNMGSYQVTYYANYTCRSDDNQINTNTAVLVYEISAGSSFLNSGTSFSFSSYPQGLYMRYTNPGVNTYRTAASPRIECVADGRTITMRDYSTSSHTVTFSEPAKWTTVEPYDSWSDIIYLKDNVTVYDTKAYTRQIYASPVPHATYSSLKMTVPLPEGAVPGFGNGDSFTPLTNGVRYSDDAFSVTYEQNRSYSNAGGTVSGTANMLVYEIHPGGFLDASSSSDTFTFRFSKLNQLYLRFTNPKGGVCQSAASPQIQVTINGETSTPYDFGRSYYLTTVTFVEPGTTSGVYPDFVEKDYYGNYCDRWSDTITLEDGKTIYDTKLYNRKVYSPASEIPHYPYDLVRMTVLLPDEATPGFGTGNAFRPLTDGQTYTISSSYGSWKVTYKEQYTYSNEDGTVHGTAKALVYELSAAESTAGFLKSSSAKTSFTFTGTAPSDRLYLRFTNPELKTYSSAAAPKVECVMDGKLFTHVGYFERTTDDTSVTFEGLKTDWGQLQVSGSSNTTPFNLISSVVLPEEYQDNKEYYGFVTNKTGYTLNNVKVSYTFDQYLNVEKLTLNLGGEGYPKSAVIVYTTRTNETEQTASLDGTDNILALEKGDAFLTAEITYDTLGNSTDPKKILTAGLHNYGETVENRARAIGAIPVSAGSPLDDSDDYSFKSSMSYFQLYNALASLRASVGTQPGTLEKGDEFTVTVTTGPYSSSYSAKEQNLSLYLRMPKGYILTSYTPPAVCKDGEYKVTNRTLENGDIMYCLEYTDNVLYDTGKHIFSFRVGPETDTSKTQTIPMPTAVYAAAGEGKLFQFYTTQTEAQLGLDINGNGDKEDRFFAPRCPTVTIKPLGILAIAGYLSSEGQAGENLSNEYGLDSTGGYRFILYNGIGSGASVSDGTLLLNLHKAGDVFTYTDGGEEKTYTSQYDVLLTGPVEPQGDFWKDCSIEYSRNGKDWLAGEQVKDYTQITHVRLRSVPDQTLESTESAYLLFPFSVRFPNNGTVPDLKNFKGYIDIHLQYALESTAEPVTANVLSELTAKPVDFSGTIFQDRNWNGVRDDEEASNDKAYILGLYSGEGTDGTPLQEITTDAVSGNYGFNVLLPGTYTLHVEKNGDEIYGASTIFDENGNYTFTLGDASIPATKDLDMGILTDAVLEKPEFQPLPASPDGKNGWYVTLPQIGLLPISTLPYVETMFWHDNETAQKLTEEIEPSVNGTGTYTFKAYNTVSRGNGLTAITSETAELDLKIDVDAPTIQDGFSCFVMEQSAPGSDSSGNFLPFGNFFRKALQITVMAEDVGSGVDALYYTLPGEPPRAAKPSRNGYFSFDIPMGTAGEITYYAEDKAGNRSNIITLKKENGSDFWMIEDKAPVWEDFVLTDANGNAGIRGTDGNIWYASSVNISARVTDEDSGLALITSRINSEPMESTELTDGKKLTDYEFTAAVETEGHIVLQAEAEDNATNTAMTQTTFGIDRTAPVIVLENKLLALAPGEPLLILTSEEQLPALASKDTGALGDDVFTATVLVKDTGSGVDPDSIRVLWQGQEMDFQITPAPAEGGYRLTFPMEQLLYTYSNDAFLVTAKDYTGWSAELSITRHQKQIIYVAADTGSDVTGDGSRTYPVQTLAAALERVRPGGMIVLLENYDGTAYVNLDVTLDLNGKILHSDVPGSAITVGSAGSLTITDSNGMASAAEGFGKDPESEGEIFGGIPGDPAFTLEGGSLSLTDGTIYCGYTGDGDVQVLEHARMMYLLTYLNGGGTGEAPGLHYIEENTTGALKQNTFSREGYTFHGWLYEDHLYTPGQEILMPGRNMVTLAKWAKEDEPEETEENRTLDSVPKTGNGKSDRSSTPRTGNRMELYIKVRKKEDEQNTEN